MTAVRAIVTAPPYATFLDEVAGHPIVCGLRLNTVMPLREGPREGLERLMGHGQPLWVDLKGRQLRVAGAAIPPYTEVRLSHSIQVETPVDAYFSDGAERARVAAVDGNRLILEDGPRRLIGPGESVNIVHPSLKIDGTLTGTDQAYLAAMAEIGLARVMLSYVEMPEDVRDIQARLPGAEMLLKIENRRGLAYARRYGHQHGHLVAARGDLFVEIGRPHQILGAMKDVIQADPEAVAASRLFESLVYSDVPSSADIHDAAYLMTIGYRKFLLGDQVCFQRDSIIAALNLLQAIAREMDGSPT